MYLKRSNLETSIATVFHLIVYAFLLDKLPIKPHIKGAKQSFLSLFCTKLKWCNMNSFRVLVFSFLIAIVPNSLFGQEVVGTSGGTDSTVNSQVTWSLGEAVIETGTVGTTDYTQGYVQPIFIIVSVEEVNSSNIFLNLFPNPATQEFNLVVEGSYESIFYVRITAINGQLIREESFSGPKHTVNINELMPATYFVEVLNENGSYYNKLKLIKTH